MSQMSAADFLQAYDWRSSIVHMPDMLVRGSKHAEILDELVKAIGVDKLTASRHTTLRRYKFTFRTRQLADAFMVSGIDFRGVHLTPGPAPTPATLVRIDNLPVEIPDAHFHTALAPFGRVLSIRRQCLKGHPTILTGTVLVRMVLASTIPYFLKVWGFTATVTYAGQSPTCFRCRAIGHKHADCPAPRPVRPLRKRKRSTPSNAAVPGSSQPVPAPPVPPSPVSHPTPVPVPTQEPVPPHAPPIAVSRATSTEKATQNSRATMTPRPETDSSDTMTDLSFIANEPEPVFYVITALRPKTPSEEPKYIIDLGLKSSAITSLLNHDVDTELYTDLALTSVLSRFPASSVIRDLTQDIFLQFPTVCQARLLGPGYKFRKSTPETHFHLLHPSQ